ncbi:putative receptor-like protein kinase At3g47110 isoform X2 [Rosa chinensis]|uniref:putative receptor-like protein kinase At3g47110 isoform X2 n=1 Tax=Rosa chinensis TaxID=74649 RepID=UPI000D08B996|nr:putative receptor-like protein kinase At3g47110 isoform X2 [Rosa chinensis]
MGVLVLKLLLIYSVLNPVFISSCSSMPLNHLLTTALGGNETDRLALLAIKANIQHDPNRVTSTWNESIHFCSWHGVTCSRRHHQRVIMLDLNSQGLAGSISPHIGNLSFLRDLRLYNNSLRDGIPPEIGRLRRLQVLNVRGNLLTGHIPANISNCFHLTILNFSHNKLALLAGGNNLVGRITSSLGQLKNLTSFSLGENMLSGTIPPSIYNLSAIVDFYVQLNQLYGSIPSDLSDAFPNLQLFNMDGNQFTGSIPMSISNATSLVSFDVATNNLRGQVPNLQKLHNLEVFSIAENHLGRGTHGDLSFVSELINATRLRWLFLGYNNFGGTLPASIANLSTNLEKLRLPGNLLQGSIPTQLGNLANLQALALQENFFTGSIPIDIGKLLRLQLLSLQNNKLSGRIPSSLGNLTTLLRLELQGNKLNGSIPSSLGKCQGLLKLDFSQNTLDGTIPQPLLNGLLYLSISLNLSKNQFTGSLPLEIGKLKNLGELDVSDNMLSGQLPGSLGSCESLEVLHMEGNSFGGLIPSSMKELRGIQDLDLSRNNFSGEIPKYLEGFAILKNLNLSFNKFSGAVPMEGVFSNASAISIVGNTNLCGGITSLQLPKCSFEESNSRTIKIIISLVSGLTLLGISLVLCFLFFRLSRKKRSLNELSNLGNSVPRVSYENLLKATDGFSSANLIGVGGFGSVFKGVLDDDRVVAVKVLNMSHWGASRSFIAECEALRNIRHRNLVKIVTACSRNDFKALVYNFMENGSLEDWLHPSSGIEEVTDPPKVLSLVQRLDIAIDVACALDYLHNHCETPLVHCDLKPSNVLLDNDLTGHISDFGLSKFLSKLSKNVSGNKSSSIGIRGSVGYAAPEYGMGSEASTYGDVYSFGILLLEMFTGKRPTDHMFCDGLNLHNYVKTALPKRVADIADSLVLQGGKINVEESHNRSSLRAQKIEGCLTSIFGIGVACSVESPTTRKDINDVASELHSIRDNLLD